MCNFSKRKVEDCFDGSRIFEYLLQDAVLTEKWVMSLKTLGVLEYFAEFPKPFFRLMTERGLQCKGVVGEKTFKVIYPKDDYIVCEKMFEDVLRGL